MSVSYNPNISIDCVVFGFDYKELKVLLVERDASPKIKKKIMHTLLKIPGSLIRKREELDHAAYRVLKELTGLDNVYLKQFSVFSNPKRIHNKADIEWLHERTGIKVEHIISVGYYSLVKLDEANPYESRLDSKAYWVNVDQIPKMLFDHNEIFSKALATLRDELRTKPIGFELLPKKFTIRQLQNLYEIIFGIQLDNRNFRKKILKQKFIISLNVKESHVNHKPAKYYKFDREIYEKINEGNKVFTI